MIASRPRTRQPAQTDIPRCRAPASRPPGWRRSWVMTWTTRGALASRPAPSACNRHRADRRQEQHERSRLPPGRRTTAEHSTSEAKGGCCISERRTMSPPPGGQLSSAPSGSPRPRAAAMTSWLLEPRSRSPLRLAAAAVSRDSCGTRRTSGQRCVRRGESLRCVPPSVPRTSSYGGFNDAGFVPSSRSSRSEFGLGLTASVNRAGDSPRSSPRSLRHPSQWWRALSARAYGSRTP